MASRSGLRRGLTSTAQKTIVLISGGNTGIGYEIVKKLATEHGSTHHVLMGCRDTAKGEAAVASMGAPLTVNPIQLDLTDDVSIEHCFKTIEQMFGRLDVLVHNAATGGRDLLPAAGDGRRPPLRDVYRHVFDVNVTGAALLTEAMVPLLDKSALPKVVFITSELGSITNLLKPDPVLVPVPFYSSSKAALNYHCAYYARLHPTWKVNACCPGLNAAALTGDELTEENHPRNGAINAVRLVFEGKDGATATWSNKEGPINY